MTETKGGLPVLAFASQAEWEAWLATNHATSSGLWLKIAKKGSGIPSVDAVQALEGGLVHGWIDGQRDVFDDRYFLQRYTPRGPRSRWSQINVDKVEKLIAEGRMQPSGMAAVEAAKADGRWAAAYEPQSRVTVPEDLQAALDANPRAAAFFATLKGANRYSIIYRLQHAKRPETRARRLAEFVQMLEEGRTIHPVARG